MTSCELCVIKKQSLIEIRLGPGVICFELLGMHESECGSETQPNVEVRPKPGTKFESY